MNSTPMTIEGQDSVDCSPQNPAHANGIARPKCEPPGRIADWLAILASGPLIEMRAFNVQRMESATPRTERGLYPTDREGLARMAKDARAVSRHAEGVYLTLNPLRGDLTGSASDADVTGRAWLFIDVDPERPAGVASTDAEHGAARELAGTIRDALAAEGWPAPIVADSGNGWHLLYRIDLPADDGGLIARVLDGLADRFDTQAAKVDRTVKNPSRVCKLYGTVARKGDPTADRPHRCSAVMEAVHPLDVVPVELLEKIAATKPTTSRALARREPARKRRKGLIVRDLGPDPYEAWATAAIEDECDKMAGTFAGSQNRNNQLFASACAILEIANTGLIGMEHALGKLRDAARSVGLDDDEIDGRFKSARKKVGGKARDTSHVGTRATAGGASQEEGGRRSHSAVDDPFVIGGEFVDASKRDGLRTIAYYRGDILEHDGCAWRQVDEHDMKPRIAMATHGHISRLNEAESDPRKFRKFTGRIAGDVLAAVKALTRVDKRFEPPCWLDGVGPFPPKDVLPTQNALVHLPSFVAGKAVAIAKPTPNFFCTYALDYDFVDIGDAPEPVEWFKFLESIWPGDQDSWDCLQEWFGYMLTPDTSRQKILLMVGPTRSGKGTINRLLTRLIGKQNVEGPTMSTLGGAFGLESLVGKMLAIIPDARMPSGPEQTRIIERLLSISGEDTLSINRKYQPDWTGRLPTRLVIASNELPYAQDASAAIVGRMICLRFTKKFLGIEDLDLDAKLAAELPSILHWAIEGWRRLQSQGRFTQPAAGLAMLEQLHDSSSPVAMFVREKCEIGAELKIPTGELFTEWRQWCVDNGHDRPGTSSSFSRRLSAAFPVVSTSNPTTFKGKVTRLYEGIARKDGF